MALDDYFLNPSQDCLARLFDAVNSMDISMAPTLSPFEKLIMRTSERKDAFLEKFEDLSRPSGVDPTLQHAVHKAQESVGSHSSFEDGILMRTQDKGKEREAEKAEKKGPTSSATSLPSTTQYSPSDASFSLDGSAVWVESGGDQSASQIDTNASSTAVASSRSTSIRGRKSTDASSSSSSHNHAKRDEQGSQPPAASGPVLKDTHFFPATIDYNDHQLPIRLPMYTFPEEVGDVNQSLDALVCTDADSSTVFSNTAGPNFLQPSNNCRGPPPSPLTYEWQPDTPHHNIIQRSNYWKAYYFPRTPQACWPSFQLCVVRMRSRLRLWDCVTRFDQAGIPVCKPDQEGGVGIDVCPVPFYVLTVYDFHFLHVKTSLYRRRDKPYLRNLPILGSSL